MKYAKEVMELLSTYPNREFTMKYLVRYVNPSAGIKEKRAIARQIHRVIKEFSENGTIAIMNSARKGSNAKYRWG